MKLLLTLMLANFAMPPPLPPPQAALVSPPAAELQPVYRVMVTGSTTKAINYQHRNGATKIDFRGTSLMPNASGEAKVESKQGYIEVEVEFDELTPAVSHGAEYLTYVLWAITPEGRTANLGEILLNGNRAKLNVTTRFQVFGLIVSAEPYFAVSRPSDLIVMENVVRSDTRGQVEALDAKFELLKRGQYPPLSNPLGLTMDDKVPLELYQARHALQIARSAGAERFAADTFAKAVSSLALAEASQVRDAGDKSIIRAARETVQTAEDSRSISVMRQQEDALSAERSASAARETTANRSRVLAQAETDRAFRDASAARLAAQLEADRLRVANERQISTDRAAAELLRLQNENKAASAQAEADALRRDLAAQQAGNQQLAAAADKAALRNQMLEKMNTVLQTRDTARGLIANMSDVLFDFGKSSLRPLAREKLARVAGIVAGIPGLQITVEGHTDNVGNAADNQVLSEQRGAVVRSYLIEQGLPPASIAVTGFGLSRPTASNDNASGRQQNRRVELILSGEAIGSPTGTP